MEKIPQNPFKPLTSNFSNNPVLFLNTDASTIEIAEVADQRLVAAKDLLDSIACMTIQNVPDNSLITVCQATYLLLSDARDLFQVAIYKRDDRE